MINDPNVEKAVNNLIEAIENSRIYSEFNEKKKIAADDDVLRSKIQRSRVIREQIHRMSEYEKDTPMTENLVDEYDNLMDVTAVHDFSLTELEFCSMYREVMARIVSSFNTDISR